MILVFEMSTFLTELRALEIPDDIIEKLKHHFNGASLYIPKPESKSLDEKAQRNTEIYLNFDGKNSRHIRKEYNLSASQICRIIRNQRVLRQRDWTI